MILTPRFAFVHLHKSGGTFVGKALLEHVPGARKLGHHAPVSQLPASHAGLPVLGVIRNPWDYYVSWFAFQSERRDYVWRTFSEAGALGFEATARRMLRAGGDAALLDRLVEQAPAEFRGRQSNLTKGCIEGLRGRRHGWYTFLFEHMYGDRPVHFIRREHLREELLDFLRKMGDVSPELEDFVRHAPPVKASRRGPYRSCYSEPLAREVAERERGLIERFGYAF